MTTAAASTATTQVYQVYINATPEAIWEAITSPEWTLLETGQPLDTPPAANQS